MNDSRAFVPFVRGALSMLVARHGPEVIEHPDFESMLQQEAFDQGGNLRPVGALPLVKEIESQMSGLGRLDGFSLKKLWKKAESTVKKVARNVEKVAKNALPIVAQAIPVVGTAIAPVVAQYRAERTASKNAAGGGGADPQGAYVEAQAAPIAPAAPVSRIRPRSAQQPRSPAPTSPPSPSNALPWIVGGVGLVAAAIAGGLALAGRGRAAR